MTRRLRILHLLNASDAGGLSRYVLDLSVALRERGHSVAVGGDIGVWHDKFRSAGIEWVELPFNSGAWGVLRAAAILRGWLGDRGGVDLFHSHYRKPTWTARFLQRKGKVLRQPPVLYTLHLSDLPVGGISRYLSDWGDHTHVASHEAADWMAQVAKVPASRVTVIPHGIDVRRWPVTTVGARARARRELGLSEADRVVAFVGRLDQNHPKNAHWVLEVVRRVEGLKALIAGDGPDRARIEGMIREGGVGDRVKLLGDTDPRPAYAAADLLLLPSGREGFSYVCAEAMATGLPVLRTRTAGTRGMIVETPGEATGRSTPIDEPAFVAAAIEMLRNPTELRETGARAAKLIRDQFTFNRQVDQTLNLYHRLTEANR